MKQKKKVNRRPRKTARFYVLHVWRDVEPELFGPYMRAKDRDWRAGTMRREDPQNQHGIFRLEAAGPVRVFAYTVA